MKNNLELWDSVTKTDPKYTKSFSRTGGFKGTAINAIYLARLATDKFGPMGIGWGLEVVEESYAEGAPIIVDGAAACKETVHKIRAKLWYKLGDERGEVTQYGLTTFIGKNKYGPYTDEEAPKKSLTDAMTKCLSLLGFSADVHIGLYDDNKYVNDLRAHFAEEEKKKIKISPTQAKHLAKLMADSGRRPDDFLAWLKIEELEDLPADGFARAEKALLAAVRKSNETATAPTKTLNGSPAQ